MQHSRRNQSKVLDLTFPMALLDVKGEVVDKKEEEVEHVWYGNLPPGDQLAQLSQQAFVKRWLQEQSQTKLAFNKNDPKADVTLRVRRVNGDESVLTSKTFREGMTGLDEESTEITSKQFEFLSKLFGMGINKMRYTIEVPGYAGKLELDVFVDKYGHPVPDLSAKYDYEVPKNQPNAPLPPLPITLLNQKHFNPFEYTEQDRQEMRAFMQRQEFRY